MKQISNMPTKGTMDWTPEEFLIRKYIFDTWRKVCLSFGYQEYLTPIVENAEIYRAKSGDDVGGKELMSFFDRGERELAIRPEMTPSVTRMVSKFYDASPKPIRLFSIANFFRNEKPQRGRNREFWQLNADIFGAESINADIEILQLAIEILLAFGADESMFSVRINDRKFLNNIFHLVLDSDMLALESKRNLVMRVLDNFRKLEPDEFKKQMNDLGVNGLSFDRLLGIMNSNSLSELMSYIDVDKTGFASEVLEIYDRMEKAGYAKYIKIDPSIIRGLDYYDGMVFEVFDKNPENNRAMFGGGRYNGLASIFGGNSFPAVGFAPGDETTKLFLQSWNLISEQKIKMPNPKVYLPLLDQTLLMQVNSIARVLRLQNYDVEVGLEVQKMNKALDYANKTRSDFVVIFNTNEKEQGIYLMKDMKSGEQKSVKI